MISTPNHYKNLIFTDFIYSLYYKYYFYILKIFIKRDIMKRTRLISLLQNYFPEAQEEKDFKQEMLKFIDKHVDCFERTLEIGHITASCWLLDKKWRTCIINASRKVG